ncbi:complement component C9-like [Pelodytes ibericus]
MGAFQYILGFTVILCCVKYGDGKRFADNSPKRTIREVNAPPPIDCQLSSWGKWSECDPCTNLMHRSRSIVKFGQYGGLRCLNSLGESQRCKTEKICTPEDVECFNAFQCDSGRCINKRLRCNMDNDCGDHSDEICDDDVEPKSPCRSQDIEVSEIGRTAGDGLNILGMSVRRNPFDNEYFNGICDRVRDGNTRKYFRKPWNVAALVYQTKADKSFTTEIFEDSVALLKSIVKETTESLQFSLSVKTTPTEVNETLSASLGINQLRNESIQAIKEYTKTTKKIFIKVSGKVELASFHMRMRGGIVSISFLDDIKSLPSWYEKAEYYSILEMYGTHFISSGTLGGKYKLVYVLDSTTLKTKDIDIKQVTDCLGYDIGLSATAEGIEANANLKSSKCDKMISYGAGNNSRSGVIEKVISFVEGGTLGVATALDEKLAANYKNIDVKFFVDWASSVVDSPVPIRRTPVPIYTLIPLEMKDSYKKSRNLERAIEDYLDEYSVCKCQPCQNGGTVMVIDGECICSCPIYYSGIACQTAKSDLYRGQPEPINGNWGCWIPSSPCNNGEQHMFRQCNNPAPGRNGKPCNGDQTRIVQC